MIFASGGTPVPVSKRGGPVAVVIVAETTVELPDGVEATGSEVVGAEGVGFWAAGVEEGLDTVGEEEDERDW